MSKLEELKKWTNVTTDTGEIEEIKRFRPIDAATNNYFVTKAALLPQYRYLVEDAIEYANQHAQTEEECLKLALDRVYVNFGKEVLKIIPGRVSLQVDSRLAYNTQAMVEKARKLIQMLEEEGFSRERVLIKLITTWEGIEAARQLEQEGIHCNMTLIFSLAQAVACLDAKVTLISPFVGMLLDWHKDAEGEQCCTTDPGIILVTKIYNYCKKFDYKVQIMAASFRNSNEVLLLAGCDFITVPIPILNILAREEGPVERQLTPQRAKDLPLEKKTVDREQLQLFLVKEAPAYEQFAKGLRKFIRAVEELEHFIEKLYHHKIS